jgi:Domain of unknown function (DUF4352)
MMMKNKFVTLSLSIIILTGCIVSTACTSTQSQTSAQSNSPIIKAPQQTINPATVPETLITTLAQTPAPTATISMTGTPANDVLTVTLNSAEKSISLGNKIGKAGRILLILDITIKNNDKRNDFTYSDDSFVITDKSTNDRVTAITSQKALPLANPLFMGTIPSGSTDNGKILFRVNATSNTYKLSVIDSTGNVLGSIDNIYVP